MNMSFGRLLAAGKSWVGGDGVGRYRMRKHIRLPKFISPQNPFKPEAAVEAPVLAAAVPVTTAAPMEMATSARRISRWGRLGAGLRRWVVFCLDLNPFSQIGQAKLPAIPHFGMPGVQGELALDKVKVMRGDLAHADLEVVQVGSGGNQAASPAWKSLTARIFGAWLK